MRKKVLITGSSKGIGASIAKVLSKDYDVFLHGRNEQNLIKLWRSSKPHIRAAITTLMKECK